LAGPGAERFARAMGHRPYDPVTEVRRRQWRERRQQWDENAPGWADEAYLLGGDTVGAVALDSEGRLAAATSTGGTGMKLPGRVGDSPVPGAGNYADKHGAASGTGAGERLMRTLLAFRVVQAMGGGLLPSDALLEAFREVRKVLGKEVGVIALDPSGNVGIHHSTVAMPYGYASEREPRPVVRLRAG
jgi:beta-aspartyl-peptidase (threonine type)